MLPKLHYGLVIILIAFYFQKTNVTLRKRLANLNFSYLVLIGQFKFIFSILLHTASFFKLKLDKHSQNVHTYVFRI